jgi:protein SCO1
MPDPTVVFVTTDPERDTPERLRDWLDKFDPSFVGLHGSPEEIRAAEDAAQVPPSMITTDDGSAPPAPEDDYEVGHAAQIIAYTPDDLAHVVYPFGVRRQDWQGDLPRLMATWGRAAERAGGHTEGQNG